MRNDSAPRLALFATLGLTLATAASLAPAAFGQAAAGGAAAPSASSAGPGMPSMSAAMEPEGRYRIVNGAGGVPLNVVEFGDASAPAILFIHGIGQSHRSFDPQFAAPELARNFRLVSFDLRGHGNSGKPWEPTAYTDWRNWAGDVQAIIDALGLQRPLLVGWSYGTLVVADYVRAHGTDRISGIVLTGAFGGFGEPPGPPDPERAKAGALLAARQQSGDVRLNIQASQDMARLLTAKPMPPQWYERAAAIGLMAPGYVRRHMFARNLDNREVAARVRVPMLLVVGEKDPSTAESAARGIAAKIPGARLSNYPGVGHSPFAEEPQRFNRELVEFARAAQGGAARAALQGR